MDRLAEAANSTTDPLARQGAFETYTALITEIGHPVEPFVALVLATILEKCSDKVMIPFFNTLFDFASLIFASCRFLSQHDFCMRQLADQQSICHIDCME